MNATLGPPLAALGIDAGGSATRWALADAAGSILAEGSVAGFSAHEIQGPARARVESALRELAVAVLAVGRPARAHAGFTGFGPGMEALAVLLAAPLGLPAAAVSLGSDLETTYLDAFTPGEGFLVYAGTGSVAVYLDAEDVLHRAGGRGHLLDDGGGGWWIAREALRRIWRREDERPGAWRESVLARELFADLGGADWATTRSRVYAGGRGDVGRLALAVARAAGRDPEADAILRAAGAELARLALAMAGRYGPRPVALGGRAASLHPLLAESLRSALPAGTSYRRHDCRPHHAAARLALQPGRSPARPEEP